MGERFIGVLGLYGLAYFEVVDDHLEEDEHSRAKGQTRSVRFLHVTYLVSW
jgi:hypothetical protein